jgi:hypothetical protein
MEGSIIIHSGLTINYLTSGEISGDNNQNYIKFKIYKNNIEDYTYLNNYFIQCYNNNNIYKFDNKLECNIYIDSTLYNNYQSIYPADLSAKTYTKGIIQNQIENKISTNLIEFNQLIIPSAFLSAEQKESFLSTYLLTSTTSKFLYSNNSRDINLNSRTFVSFLSDIDTNSIHRLLIILRYNDNITVNYTDSSSDVTNVVGMLTTIDYSAITRYNCINNFSIGTDDLNDLKSIIQSQLNKYIANDIFNHKSLLKIEFKLYNEALQIISETYTLNINHQTRAKILINFKNLLGGSDSKLFYIFKEKNSNMSNDNLLTDYKFKKNIKKNEISFELFSDWYKKTEHEYWLEFLKGTNHWTVYNNKLYSVEIKRDVVEFETNKNLRNLKLTIKLKQIEKEYNLVNRPTKIDERLL